MIGRLRGVISQKTSGYVLIDVGGVGYVVHCSDRTIANLPRIGEEAVIHTDLQVREDLMQLYGFSSTVEREWYWLLTSVQGVGAKAALAILGVVSVQNLARALTIGDTNTVRAAPGVGPKLAERICLELKEKAAKLMGTISASGTMQENGQENEQENGQEDVIEDFSPSPKASTKSAQSPVNFPANAPTHEAEAISALVNLGYDRVIAAQTIGGLADQDLDLSALISTALRAMAPKG